MNLVGVRPLYKGLLIAALHFALVASLGAKLLYDRSTRPRVWAQTMPYDPDLPIRGRYVSLSILVETRGFPPPARAQEWSGKTARLAVSGDKLVAFPDDNSDLWLRWIPAPGVQRPPAPIPPEPKSDEIPVDYPTVAILKPVLYFIPEHAPDPSRRAAGEELWVEVTVPKRGAPRPIRLGVKQDGRLTPLDLR